MPAQRILISMPDKFLADIDKVAKDENRNRSELIREALRTYMNKQSTISKYVSMVKSDEELIG